MSEITWKTKVAILILLVGILYYVYLTYLLLQQQPDPFSFIWLAGAVMLAAVAFGLYRRSKYSYYIVLVSAIQRVYGGVQMIRSSSSSQLYEPAAFLHVWSPLILAALLATLIIADWQTFLSGKKNT